MARVNTHVHVHDADGTKHAALKPGDQVPGWAVVTNKAVLVEDSQDEKPAKDDAKAPASSGPRARSTK